jgi:multidrug transporter EmrE-like cation transporter
MKTDNSEKNQRDLFKIMTISTALAFGVMLGLFCSINEITHHFTVAFSVWTIVGFVAGATLGWLFWRTVKRLEERARRSGDKSHHQ